MSIIYLFSHILLFSSQNGASSFIVVIDRAISQLYAKNKEQATYNINYYFIHIYYSMC
jgi:hypothetical protein